MATIVQVAGKVTVKVGMGDSAAVELGFTRNGVQYTEEGFYGDVPGDEYGGDEGPPIDVQYFGEVHRIRCELTKYDATVAKQVTAKVAGAAAGTPADPGTLYFAQAKYMRVGCSGTNPAGVNHIRNYPYCIPRMPVELNAGTKFSTLVIEFEAHKKPGQSTMYTETA